MADTKTPTVVTPKTLGEELNVSPKAIRTFLRREFARDMEMKNTSWSLNAKQAKAVREQFTPKQEKDEA